MIYYPDSNVKNLHSTLIYINLMFYNLINFIKKFPLNIKKIAIYHNLTSGGNKRELFEFTKRLKLDDNELHLYANAIEESQYLNLTPHVDNVHLYHFKKIKYISFTFPFFQVSSQPIYLIHKYHKTN